jgi:small conductance mechanosensitive channel
LDWTFGIGYDADLDAAKATIKELLESDERVLKDKPILVELGAMADSSVNLTTRAWVKSEDYWSVHYSMNENVYKIFNARGISIPYPQMDVHLHK